MSGVDRAGLREVAEAATPGPWGEFATQCIDGEVVNTLSPEREVEVDIATLPRTPQGSMDLAFIAAADPPTVPALLDELDAAEARLAAVRELLADWQYGAEQPASRKDSDTDLEYGIRIVVREAMRKAAEDLTAALDGPQ